VADRKHSVLDVAQQSASWLVVVVQRSHSLRLEQFGTMFEERRGNGLLPEVLQ
jgi:hypothetical protein